MSNDEEAYGNTHRAFLQAFLGRSTFTVAQAKPVLAAIQNASQRDGRPTLAGDITESEFLSYVSSINASISPFDMEIRSTHTQGRDSRTRIWAIVNTTSDPITQLATTHTADEIGFVKRVLDDMFDKYNTPRKEIMAINNTRALRLNKASTSDRRSGVGMQDVTEDSQTPARSSNQSITMSQADKMLKSMVDEGWFEIHRDYYTLSPRAIMELRGWLFETYNDPVDEEGPEGAVERIKLCHACGDIVTDGQRCSVGSCKARLHDHCAQGVWRVQRNETCPICREAWNGNDFVGLRVVLDADRRRSSGSAERRRTTNAVEDDDDDEAG